MWTHTFIEFVIIYRIEKMDHTEFDFIRDPESQECNRIYFYVVAKIILLRPLAAHASRVVNEIIDAIKCLNVTWA